MNFAHIINPVKAEAGSELDIAQPVTFESIRVAKEFSKGDVNVELFAICFEEDREIVPGFFRQLNDLKRSVLDFGKFSIARKYPVMEDVLRALYDASDAEYLIYSNMDIALMPHFYSSVATMLKENFDVLLVNRRGISKKFKSVSELPLMYAEYGKPHPGFDCFIFKRELLDKIMLGKICLGVSFSEVALLHNFIAFGEKVKVADDVHLTFHIGTEVMPPLNPEFYWHNRHEYERNIYPKLKPFFSIDKFPYSELPFHKRMVKWLLNPSFRTHKMAEMEGKNWYRKFKYDLDSIRFSLLEKIR